MCTGNSDARSAISSRVNAMGTHATGGSPTSARVKGNSNPAGMTPTTVYGRSSRRSTLPIAPGSPQSVAATIVPNHDHLCRARTSSSAVNVRPRIGVTPSVENSGVRSLSRPGSSPARNRRSDRTPRLVAGNRREGLRSDRDSRGTRACAVPSVASPSAGSRSRTVTRRSGSAYGGTSQDHGVDDAEDRGVHADAERQIEDRDHHESWMLGGGSHGVSQSRNACFEKRQCRVDRDSASFTPLDAAKPRQREPARLARIDSAPHQVLDVQREMALELVVQLAIAAAASKTPSSRDEP